PLDRRPRGARPQRRHLGAGRPGVVRGRVGPRAGAAGGRRRRPAPAPGPPGEPGGGRARAVVRGGEAGARALRPLGGAVAGAARGRPPGRRPAGRPRPRRRAPGPLPRRPPGGERPRPRPGAGGRLERAVVWDGADVAPGEELVDAIRTDAGVTVLVR